MFNRRRIIPSAQISFNMTQETMDLYKSLLRDKLSSIQHDLKQPWLAATHFPTNLSGREYNEMNGLMLSLQAEKEGYDLPFWATFDRIAALNYTLDKQGKRKEIIDMPKVTINEGAKSFPVMLQTFSVESESGEQVGYDEYRKMPEERREEFKVMPTYQMYNVFNVAAQTNIKEARPELYARLQRRSEDVSCPFSIIDRMINKSKWVCPIKPTCGDNNYYSISKDEIVVSDEGWIDDAESFYTELFHEMAHSTGAVGRLNRLVPSSFGSKEYAREELFAELTAAVVAQHYGMAKCIKEDSIAYLRRWIELLDDFNFVMPLLIDMKKADSMIINNIEEHKK